MSHTKFAATIGLVLAILPLSQVSSNTAGTPEVAAAQTEQEVEARVAQLVAAMTRDEKLALVLGYYATDFPPKNFHAPAEARYGSAGYVPGVARLGIPPQWQTDAGAGVATQHSSTLKRERTGLPSGLAIAASWNPMLAREAGAMIGGEAHASGFNVMLAGGVNLLRDPRNGRNFEYGGEDPLLAGTIVGAQIGGIQSQHIISTVKHLAFNDQETGRRHSSVVLADDAARMSDLLAFQIAIERGKPGSVMCAYNRVGGVYACESRYLLTDVLRRDWGWNGYVMSDWGATHSTVAAVAAGLDQQSGVPFDEEYYFGKPLGEAIADGRVPAARLDEMVGRILRAMITVGAMDHPAQERTIDFAANAKISQKVAEEAIVLLRNENALLPLSPAIKSIAVIGGYADKGVLSGGGSSQVYPIGRNAVPGLSPTTWPGPVVYNPSSPLEAIRKLAPNAKVTFASGDDPAAAAELARNSDVAIVFATQWATETKDVAIALGDGQDALIAQVSAGNPKTVVVLETGGPVLMPWVDQVGAVMEAWYPGAAGGQAIARVLFGEVNPSGRLPATFPRAIDQLVRPGPIDPKGLMEEDKSDIVYSEGAAVGYKWFDSRKMKPLFAFGHGLGYTDFGYSKLKVRAAGPQVTATFTVRNTGARAGMAVPQVYVAPLTGGWEAPKRLGGWDKIEIAPGKARRVSVTIDPRLLATYNSSSREWRIAAGRYRVSLGAAADDLRAAAVVDLKAYTFPAGWSPEQSPQRK
jgi:beta-glucosidase